MNPRTPEPNYHGRQLLRELVRLRIEAGLSQKEAGDRVRIEFQKLSRIENAQLPTYHELIMMLDVYGVLSCDWQPYLDLWELAKKRGWWRPYRVAETRYIRMEDEADTKYEFQLGYLPALLQTESYARTAFKNTMRFRSDETVNNEVAVRMHQQERLFTEPQLKLHTLLYEPTLHHGVGRAQLGRLLDRAELPNVTLQIVPQTGSLHEGLHGSMVLLSFDDRHEPDAAFTTTILGLSQTQELEQTSTVRRTLDHLAATAISPDDSITLIKSLEADFAHH